MLPFVYSLLIVWIISRYSLKPPSYTMIQEFVDTTFRQMINDENYRDKIIKKCTEKFDKLSEEYSTTTQLVVLLVKK